MPRNFVVGAVALIVGIALGFGGTWAMTSTTQDRPVSGGWYDVAHNDHGGTELTVGVATSTYAAFTLVLIVEKSDRVEVTIRERVSRGFSTQALTLYRFTWTLGEPLGSRLVVDASTGMEIVRAEPAVTALDPTGAGEMSRAAHKACRPRQRMNFEGGGKREFVDRDGRVGLPSIAG